MGMVTGDRRDERRERLSRLGTKNLWNARMSLSQIVLTYPDLPRRHTLHQPTLASADFRTSRDLDIPRPSDRPCIYRLLLWFPDPPCLSLGMLLHSFSVPHPHPSIIHASWLTGRLIERAPLMLQPARDRKTLSFHRRSAP